MLPFLFDKGEYKWYNSTIIKHKTKTKKVEVTKMNKLKLFKDTLNFLESFMTTQDWCDENIPEQSRAIFTTLCIIGKLEADTSQSDSILKVLYQKAALDRVIEYDEFENFMYELIV